MEVTMVGGKPWGLRMQGGKGTDAPLKVAQVTNGSKSQSAGLSAGQVIVAINGVDTSELTMVEAQNIIKETGDSLALTVQKGEDPLLDSVKRSCGGAGNYNMENPNIKGNTFKMLKSHIDAGQTGSVLSSWDKEGHDRNKSVPTNAPKLQAEDKGYDKSAFGLSDDRHSRQTAFMVHMKGGRPWGFKIQGGMGTGTPLYIASVTPNSKAHEKRLLVGDQITSINEQMADSLTMQDAQELIKSTGDKLKLGVIKHGLKNTEQCGATNEETENARRRLEAEEDPDFFKTLADTVKGGTEDWSGREVKGGAFKMLQNVVDSGNVAK